MDFNQNPDDVMKKISEVQKELLKPQVQVKNQVRLLKKPGKTTFKPSNGLEKFRRNDLEMIDNTVTFTGQKLNGNIININDDLRHNNNSFQFITNYRMHKGNHLYHPETNFIISHLSHDHIVLTNLLRPNKTISREVI